MSSWPHPRGSGVEETTLRFTGGDAEAQWNGDTHKVPHTTTLGGSDLWSSAVTPHQPLHATIPWRRGRGSRTHSKQHNSPWGCANWQHTLPGVRTNAKGTSKVESGRRKVWLREEWQDIPGHENVPTKGNGRREHGADLPHWKEEHAGRYTRMVRLCVPPLGSNPGMLQYANTPHSWSWLRKRNGMAVAVWADACPHKETALSVFICKVEQLIPTRGWAQIGNRPYYIYHPFWGWTLPQGGKCSCVL